MKDESKTVHPSSFILHPSSFEAWMSSKRDYYEVLSVERNASTEDIEKAYRKLARQFHPDRNIGDPDAETKFKEVTEAHEILVNEDRRARYDRYGHAGVNGSAADFGPASGNFSDIVSDLFSAFMGGGGQRRRGGGPKPGGDRRQIIEVQLQDLIQE